MRTPLGDARPALAAAVLACALVSACGGSDDHATDPASPPSPAGRSTSPTTTAQGRVLAVVNAPASGPAEVDPTPVDIGTPDRLQSYATTLGRGSWAEQIQAAVDHADLAGGLAPYAAVIAIGCDVPDALITGAPGDWQVVAAKVEDPKPECFVATMTVAVVALPA